MLLWAARLILGPPGETSGLIPGGDTNRTYLHCTAHSLDDSRQLQGLRESRIDVQFMLDIRRIVDDGIAVYRPSDSLILIKSVIPVKYILNANSPQNSTLTLFKPPNRPLAGMPPSTAQRAAICGHSAPTAASTCTAAAR